MRATLPLAVTAASLVLVGCTATPLPPGEDEPGAGEVSESCLVGTWNLDVADYETQARDYLIETGIPLVSYELGGVGTIEFTADGDVTTDIDIVTDYVVDAAGEQLTRQSLSVYTGAGSWEVGFAEGTIVISDYETVESGALNPADSGLPPVMFIDIGSFDADCTDGSLALQGPVASIFSHWDR
jgi:hypothetical protein